MTDNIERLLRDARATAASPALGAGTARTVISRVRHRQRLQTATVGGAAAVVVAAAGTAVALGGNGPKSAGGFEAAGAPPSPLPVASASTSADPSTPVASSPATPVGQPFPTSSGEPNNSPACLTVEKDLDPVAGPTGYGGLASVAGTPIVWQRTWTSTQGSPAVVGLSAFCKAAAPADFHPDAAKDGSVTPVTVNGHEGWLVIDSWGTFASVTWNPNPTTQLTVAAGPSTGPVSASPSAGSTQARLSNDDLLAFARSLPTG